MRWARSISPGIGHNHTTLNRGLMSTSETNSGGVFLTRLECKEVLRNLDRSNCDDEVVQKIMAGAKSNTPVQQIIALSSDAPTVPIPQSTEIAIRPTKVNLTRRVEIIVDEAHATGITQGDPLDPLAVPQKMALTEYLQSKRGGEWTQEEIDAVNTERMSTWKAQMRMQRRPHNLNSRDAANADFAPPEFESAQAREAYRIVFTEVGAKNSVGDVCIDIADGLSVFVCPNRHGYVANNPAVPGCTMCAAIGQSSVSSSSAADADNDGEDNQESDSRGRFDSGAIAGQDSRW